MEHGQIFCQFYKSIFQFLFLTLQNLGILILKRKEMWKVFMYHKTKTRLVAFQLHYVNEFPQDPPLLEYFISKRAFSRFII